MNDYQRGLLQGYANSAAIADQENCVEPKLYMKLAKEEG